MDQLFVRSITVPSVKIYGDIVIFAVTKNVLLGSILGITAFATYGVVKYKNLKIPVASFLKSLFSKLLDYCLKLVAIFIVANILIDRTEILNTTNGFYLLIK